MPCSFCATWTRSGRHGNCVGPLTPKASVKAIAEAREQRQRDRIFSTAIVVYSAAGILAGAVLVVVGIPLLRLFDIPQALQHEARLAMVALAVSTAAGWPLKVFQDALRGSRRFVAASAAEGAAYVVLGAALGSSGTTNGDPDTGQQISNIVFPLSILIGLATLVVIVVSAIRLSKKD